MVIYNFTMFFAGSEEEYILKNDSCDVILEVRIKRYCRSQNFLTKISVSNLSNRMFNSFRGPLP